MSQIRLIFNLETTEVAKAKKTDEKSSSKSKISRKSVRKTVSKSTDKTRKALKKEVHLPVRLPDNKAGKFLGKQRKVSMPQYFKDSWQELKKVTWPSRKDTLKLTLAVILFTGFFALFIALADYFLSRGVERIFL